MNVCQSYEYMKVKSLLLYGAVDTLQRQVYTTTTSASRSTYSVSVTTVYVNSYRRLAVGSVCISK